MSTTASPPTGGATAAAPPGALSHRQILTILSGLMLGMFLAALDQTIVSTSIRTIADDLHGLSQQAWATTAYLITSTIATPLYGKLSDLHGRKPYYLSAITIFVIGSAACTFSTSMTELAAFRAFQGLGAGGLMSLALAIIGDIVPPRERARYQGYMLGVFATSSVAGPLIGGFLAGQSTLLGITGWRWVFLVNVPIGVIALFVVAKVLNLPHTRRDHRIDWWGAVTIAIGVVPLLLVAEQGREWGWGSTRSILCYAIGVVGIIAWVFVERWVGDDALIPMRLFRNGTFSKTSLLSVLIGMGMFGGMLMIPQYLQIVKGASPTKSGLEMLPLMLGMMIASVVSGQITSKTGRYKIFPVIGTALMVAAMLLFHFEVQWDTPLWQTMVYMLVFGLGLGCCMQTLVLAVQNAVPPKDMGVATASSTFFRQMGATAGTAIFLSVLFSSVGDKIASAFRSAAGTASFQAALHDPAVLSDPANKPVLMMLKHPGAAGSGGGVLSDSSFIQKLDPRLGAPFKQGFADSMHGVFLLGAIVIAVAFVLVLFVKEVPLRQVSGLQARAAAEAENAAGGEGGGAPEGVATTAELPAPRGGGAHRAGPRPEPAPQPAPATTAVLDAVAPATGPAVTGSVRDGEGHPVAQAVVTLIDAGGRQLGRTVTGEDGGYAIATPGAGTYVLIGSAGARQPQAATVVVGDAPVPFDLVLAGAAGLAGEVRQEAGGAPVPGALVVATDVRGEVVASGAAGADGGFTFGELVPGVYTLAVSAEGHRPAALPVEVTPGTPNWYEVRLAAGARIGGTVLTPQGQPVDDARVTLVDPAGNVVGTAITGADGVYGFSDLDGGEYTVIASGYAPVATPLRIDGPGRTEFDVDLGHDPAN
ncbi:MULTISPECIES: MFS transporter [Streptomycetaceae]|uniref:Putative multidrug-efflux transporter n=1 Tax=Streptantibioticus cattleyicolor (strain ATCC 35852 / DSM 46488 / JCM 4925 / NBRC 14057 / NRRL 8057) TaxID=1003195 RepID=F8K1E2_STREN|nr:MULTISPECIES: MFS transporter [Streptomycetaceae]AEW97436.1 putative multidrug-efflux transporter [Streptantibioticus cattleyicolor NRRL 8057 = DSM 46488]MYS61875.1 DHA2 family efflux MFS transporter permease subunit [Streptomyces sp. SID5468]CCB77757.1 Putative multidrug-efflux transporter (modular protein) [Streptantibioticus cattleyicolor NRRL 8057 = DSM 46488]